MKNLRKLFTAKIVKIIRCYLIILFLKKFQRIKVIRKLNKYFDPNWLRKVHGFKYKQNLKIINWNQINLFVDINDHIGFRSFIENKPFDMSVYYVAKELKLKKDDEVIVPAFSFITTASSFARTGCKLRYCDIEKENLMPSFNQIKNCVNKKTKAIVIVHYQGYSVDFLDKLQIFCKKKKIILIEDAAQSFGSYFKNKPLGSFGDFACFSFHETKNLHSGLGGMLVVNNKKFINQSYLIFDKGCLVNSLYHYPLNMTFFSTSDKLEIGEVPFISHNSKPTRAEALEYYRRVASHWDLNLNLYESIDKIEKTVEQKCKHLNKANL